MADEELELDVAKPKSKKTMIIVILLILLLNGGGIGAWLYLSASDSSKGEEKVDFSKMPLHYQTLEPEFIINFPPGSKVRYLQVDLQVATRDQSSLATVATYKPVIRNDILVTLSNVSFSDLNTRAGKEKLQKKILNTLNRIVSEAIDAETEEGKKAKKQAKKKDRSGQAEKNANGEQVDQEEMIEGPIENVYFSSFIMQ